MFNSDISLQVYTPEQVAGILQIKKNTVYDLIKKGEIIAKKIGKVYRVPATSLSFAVTGLDYDLYQKTQIDKENIDQVHEVLNEIRKKRTITP